MPYTLQPEANAGPPPQRSDQSGRNSGVLPNADAKRKIEGRSNRIRSLFILFVLGLIISIRDENTPPLDQRPVVFRNILKECVAYSTT